MRTNQEACVCSPSNPDVQLLLAVPQTTLRTLSTLWLAPRETASEFCFPETLIVSWGEAKRSIEVEGKQTSLFPTGPVIKCFVIYCTSQLKTRKKPRRNRLHNTSWLINLPRFQGARPYHVRFKSSCCFPRELESWLTARDTFSSNQKTYLSWEGQQASLITAQTSKINILQCLIS